MRNARRSRRLKLTPDQLEEVASHVYGMHRHWVSKGFKLCGQSGVWARQNGGRTFRLVYRHRKNAQSLVFTGQTYGDAFS